MPTIDELMQMMRTTSMNEIRKRLERIHKKENFKSEYETICWLFQPKIKPRVNTRAEGGSGK